MCSKRGILRTFCLIVGYLFFASSSHAAPVINEFVPHPSTGNPEWVEFFTASDSAEYLKSYYIDDDTSFESDSGSSAKKPLTTLNTTSAAFPFIVFTSAILNNDGDPVVLFDAAGLIVDQYTYYESPGSDISIGRYPDGGGGFFTLSSTTQSQSNTGPVATPTPTSGPTSTPTNTPAPTATIGPTPTKPPTPSPVRSPTPEKPMTLAPDSSNNEEYSTEASILGILDENASPASSSAASRPLMPVIISLLLVGIGLALLSLATLWKKHSALRGL